MSIERSQSTRANDAAQRREPVEQKPIEKREPPSAERVSRFRAAMEQARDRAGQLVPAQEEGGELQALAQQQQRAADARVEQRGAHDENAQSGVLSEVVEDKAQRRADDLGLSASSLPPADASALFQAQMALRDGAAPTQAPPSATNPQAFADLIERHVRQLAVGDNLARQGDGQVLLRMADSTLPGTDLLLTRSGDGWTLRADVRSRDSFDAIREAAPELAKRFAERNLGALEIDPHFHG